MSRVSVFLDQVEAHLVGQRHHDVKMLWFKRLVYLLLLVKMLLVWSELDVYLNYGLIAHGLSGQFEFNNLIFWSGFNAYVHAIWGTCCLFVFCAVFLKTRYWISILVSFISMNLMSLTYTLQNSGDFILNFFVFLLIFFNENIEGKKERQILNNAVCYFIILNIAGIYFVNGFVKVINPEWRTGIFLGEVWELKYYANPHLIPDWFTARWVMFCTAWGVMLFELLFPFLLFFRLLRKWLVLIGILFHIFIGLFLSLAAFAAVMLLPYILLANWKTKQRSLKI